MGDHHSHVTAYECSEARRTIVMVMLLDDDDYVEEQLTDSTGAAGYTNTHIVWMTQLLLR
jgi:hypothetical protein